MAEPIYRPSLRNAAKVLLGVVLGLLLALSTPATADTGLTSLVNAAYFPRTEDAGLHDIAHQRAIEISTNYSHAGRRPGTAEVLAYNGLGASRAVEQWQGSPDHNAILSDPTYTLIGCGSHVVGGAYYAACVLVAGPQSTPSAKEPSEPSAAPPDRTPATPQPVLLPNTAIQHGDGTDREEH